MFPEQPGGSLSELSCLKEPEGGAQTVTSCVVLAKSLPFPGPPSGPPVNGLDELILKVPSFSE